MILFLTFCLLVIHHHNYCLSYLCDIRECVTIHVYFFSKLFKKLPKTNSNIYVTYGGYRFIICEDCNGSHWLFREKSKFVLAIKYLRFICVWLSCNYCLIFDLIVSLEKFVPFNFMDCIMIFHLIYLWVIVKWYIT